MTTPMGGVRCDYGIKTFNFFLFVKMENLPNLLYSLAADGKARKEKGSGKKKKKRQSGKMAMKQRKGCGDLQTKAQPKTTQTSHFRRRQASQRRNENEMRKRRPLSTQDTEQQPLSEG